MCFYSAVIESLISMIRQAFCICYLAVELVQAVQVGARVRAAYGTVLVIRFLPP